jgi:predicted O-methyltransferase YrrM
MASLLPVNYDSIHGWCTQEKANYIIDLVKQHKPTLSVELGVFGGKSLLPFALAAQTLPNPSVVVGVDAWSTTASLEGENSKANDDWWAKIDYNNIYHYTQDLMKTYGVQHLVKLIKSSSRDVAQNFVDQSIDILHQDSNHSETVSCEEVELYWNKVKHRGIWIFDDTDWETTQRAQQLLLSKGYEQIYTEANRRWTVFQRVKA